MAVVFEHVFDGGETGIRLVTKPNEALKKETLWLQLRVFTGPQTTKLVQVELQEDGVDFQDEFFDAILQHKIKDIGKQCEKCERYFLPHSPNQKKCSKCKEDS